MTIAKHSSFVSPLSVPSILGYKLGDIWERKEGRRGGRRRTQNRDYLQIGPLSSSSRERKKEISLSSLGPKRNSLPLSFRFSVPFYRISRDCKKTASLFRPRKTLLKNKKRWRCLTQSPPSLSVAGNNLINLSQRNGEMRGGGNF